MGKPYDHQYFGENSNCTTGTMICAGCNKPIQPDQSFRSYKRSKAHDWDFVTHHKKCCLTDPEWARIAARQQQQASRHAQILQDLRAVAKKYSITDDFSFADYAAESLGGDLEEYLT
jgi:hypothetical protein